MYHFWRQNPLFRPALFLIAGILLYDFFAWSFVWIGILVFANALSKIWMNRGAWRRVQFFIPSVFLLLGACLHAGHKKEMASIHEENTFTAILQSEPKIKPTFVSFEAKLQAYDSSRHALKNLQETIQIQIKNDHLAENLLPGDILLFKGNLRPMKGPANPSTFNYSTFMARKEIFAQVWIDSGSWTKLQEQKNLKRFAVVSRNQVLRIIDAHISSSENRAILKALLTGYTQELIPEIREVYAKSGTMHMLAVSGMHVGILLLLLSQSLRWVRNSLLKNTLLIFLLWLFALFTGLSPSVMRAASMCSLYLLAEALGREHRSWNAVAFALIVLLVWDTNYLFIAGFQLSFLALSGILLIHQSGPPPKGIKDKLSAWFKTYLAISLAAQLATSPIALFYFHQFPLYFLLGNLLIVPLAAPLMYGGIFLLLFHQIAFIAKPLAWILEQLLSLTHWLASTISQLPYSSIPIDSVNHTHVLLSYALFICLILRIKLNRNGPIISALVVLCLAMMGFVYTEHKAQQQSGLIIYSNKSITTMDYYQGGNFKQLGPHDSQLAESKKVFRSEHHIHQLDSFSLQLKPWGRSIIIDSLRVLCLDSDQKWTFPKSSIKTLLVLEKDAQGELHALMDSLNFCTIVLAGNLNWKSRKHWQKQADSLGVLLYDIREKGAFELKNGYTR